MLARKKRLSLKKEFGRIRQDGKNYDSPSFGLLVSYGSDNPRVAFIVSKKIDKRSVVRNNIKRKFSDAITSFLPRLPQKTELVFLARPKAVESTREELKNEIEAVLRRTRLITN